MQTTIVLPVKSFGRAKSRTAPMIDATGRAILAEAMVCDVLAALCKVQGIREILVVTREPRAIQAADDVGAVVVPDRAESGHVPAAVLGADAARARGAERVLLVPGDCPAVDPEEIEQLLAVEQHGEVVIVPDRHGTGTNALLLTPPDVMVPAFGPESFARHVAFARGAGATVRVAALASLALDVDEPEDLGPLTAALAALPDAAPRTRAALAQLALLGAA